MNIVLPLFSRDRYSYYMGDGTRTVLIRRLARWGYSFGYMTYRLRSVGCIEVGTFGGDLTLDQHSYDVTQTELYLLHGHMVRVGALRCLSREQGWGLSSVGGR